jgi:3-oxosteroid 1-dehydrogenase
MFLTAGYEMINFLMRKGVRLVRCAGWSDYYPNHKGGNAAGRAVEGIPFDAAELGNWSQRVQPPLAKNYNRAGWFSTTGICAGMCRARIR